MARFVAARSTGIPAGSLSPFLAGLCLFGAGLIEGMSHLFGFATRALDPGSVALLGLLCAALRLSPRLRRQPWLTVPVDAFMAVVVILDITLIFPWQAQAFAFPLADDLIGSFDRTIGFDYVAWMQWLNRHAVAAQILALAYGTMIPQAILILVMCLITGRVRHLDRYLCAFVIAILLTSALSILLPTHGFVAVLDPALRGTPAWPFAATDVTTYDALRSGALRDLLGLPTLGIVSFPSFHAASAVLGAWAFRAWPATRCPALALNAVMAVASVSCGGHYLLDVLVGFIVGGISIALAVYGSELGYALLARRVRHGDGASQGWFPPWMPVRKAWASGSR